MFFKGLLRCLIRVSNIRGVKSYIKISHYRGKGNVVARKDDGGNRCGVLPKIASCFDMFSWRRLTFIQAFISSRQLVRVESDVDEPAER